ncbi:MAG: FAD-binding oxidoreductase [SAR324 cluster bacterium]|nr:FAD-binding oxidoreductase [SAR324 cluster bacterium]
MKLSKSFQPDWEHRAPEPESYRSIFKWGNPEAYKHPSHQLYEMMKKKFGMTDEDFKEKKLAGNEKVACETPPQLTATQIHALQEIVGESNVATDDYSRVKYSNGKTAEEAMKLRRGINGKVADVVVHPRSREDILGLVQYCDQEKIPLYVYGGGSSVNMGFKSVKGGISLVMNSYMNRVLEFSETNQTITVEGGMMGPDYERLLNNAPVTLNAKQAFTGGHFPQSFEYSSVGGWAVTLGSGQYSSYYGDACDMVMSMEVATPKGVFKTHDFPATATGPKVNDIFMGSEGSFGVLISVTMKIFRYNPENTRRFAFIFPNWQAAVSAAREISQGEFGSPSLFRISDEEETDVGLKLYGLEGTPLDTLMKVSGYSPMKRCLFLGQADGDPDFAKLVKQKVQWICMKNRGLMLGGFPVSQWEHGRFADPYMREDLNDYGIVIDTLESGVTWDNLHILHQGVRKFIKKRPNTICMTHASHFYQQGTNLYFIFIAKIDDLEEYRKFQDGVIEAIHQHGGSLSHHHGVGKMIGPWIY